MFENTVYIIMGRSGMFDCQREIIVACTLDHELANKLLHKYSIRGNKVSEHDMWHTNKRHTYWLEIRRLV